MSSDVDAVIGGLQALSDASYLRDMIVEAVKATDLRCGNCNHWMKSRACPREHNVNGQSRGPSWKDRACDQFFLTQSAKDLQSLLVAKAIEFATEKRLPIPKILRK